MLHQTVGLFAIGAMVLAAAPATASERRDAAFETPSERPVLTVAPSIEAGAAYKFETTIHQVRSDRLREEIRKIHKVERLDVQSPSRGRFHAELATIGYRMSDTDPFQQRLHHTFALAGQGRTLDLELAPDGFVAAARDWRPAVRDRYVPTLTQLRKRMPSRVTREVVRPYFELLEMSDQTAGQTLAETLTLWTGAFSLGLSFGETVRGKMIGLAQDDADLVYDVSATYAAIEDGLARLEERWELDHEQLERQTRARIARAQVSERARARMLGRIPQDMSVTIERTSWIDIGSGMPMRVEIKKHVRKGALGTLVERRTIDATRLDTMLASN